MNFVAPCSVVLFALFIRLSLLLSHETNLRCIYSHTNLTSSIGTKTHWVKLAVLWQKRLTKQSAILKSSCRPDAVFLNFLLLCGDVSLNPGPGIKHPCGVCVKPVKSNQKAIQCDYCSRWYHARCCNINNPIYDALANSSCMWNCCDCGLPSFSSQCTSTVRVMSLNCCSLRSHSKRLDFQLMVATYKPDVSGERENPTHRSQIKRFLNCFLRQKITVLCRGR